MTVRGIRLALLTAALATGTPTRAAASTLHDRLAAEAEMPFALDPRPDVARRSALLEQARADPALSPLDQALAERLLATALVVAEQFDKALAAQQRGTTLLDKAGQERSTEYAKLLEARARAEMGMADIDKALIDANRAESIEIALFGPASRELFGIEAALTDIMGSAGRLDEAIAYARRATSHGEPRAADAADYVSALGSLSVYLSRRGDEEEGIATDKTALAAAYRLLPPGHHFIGILLTNFGSDVARLGRLGEAESIGREGLAFNVRNFGRDAFDTAASMAALASILRRSGRIDEAEVLAHAAVAALRKLPSTQENPHVMADSQRVSAYIAMDRRQFAEAESYLTDALASLEKAHDRKSFYSNVQSTIAEVRFLKGDLPGALDAVEKALLYFGKALAPYASERVDAETLRALVLARMGRADEAWMASQATALAMEGELFADRASTRSRTELARQYRPDFVRIADVALTTGHDEAAFRAAQLATYTELTETNLALAARAASRDATASQLVTVVQQLQVRLERLDRERSFAIGRAPQTVSAIESVIARTGGELDTRLAMLNQTFPAYGALTRPRFRKLAEVRQAMAAGQTLLLPLQSDDRFVAMSVSAAGMVWAATALDQRAGAAAIAVLRDAVDGSAARPAGFDTAAAWTLGNAVFPAGLAAQMSAITDIVVIGSGPIMTVPFGMLLTAPPRPSSGTDTLRGQPFALRRFAFAVWPSLAEPGGAASGPTQAAFLGVGAPLLGPQPAALRGGKALVRGGLSDTASLRDLPSLPGAADELRAIARALPEPGNVLLTGADATEGILRGQPLDRFGVLAFATHGLINGEMRALHEPALVMTPPPGEPTSSDNDGLLTASEIAGLRLNARWVILSACNTGAGAENGAGGYSGLARGFIQAGARSLLVSLWPVRDDVAARLTVQTVRYNAAGLSQAQALRKATLALIDDRRVAGGADPAVWAPYSLVTQP